MPQTNAGTHQLILNIYLGYVNIGLWQVYSLNGSFNENKNKQIDERNSKPRDGQSA